jgi:TMEM175 potassium channel family protein
MADAEGTPGEQRQLRTGRLEAFSDGVFAIAITLLVLEIGVPSGSEDDLLGAFVDQWHSYLAYVVSFATIGLLWLEHAVITEHLERADAMLVRLNLLLLMVVSFLPFPTALIAQYGGDDDAGRVATTVYGMTLLVAACLVSLLWRYAVGARLARPELADDSVRTLTIRLTPGLAGYVVMIVLGLFFPTLAVLGYLAIAVLLLVPFSLLRRRSRT